MIRRPEPRPSVARPAPHPPGPPDYQAQIDRILSMAGTAQASHGAAVAIARQMMALPPPAQHLAWLQVLSRMGQGAGEHQRKLAEENRRLKQPPRKLAVLEKVWTDSDGRPLAWVSAPDGSQEVPVSVELDADALVAGHQVVLAQGGAVLADRGPAFAYPSCEFDRDLGDGRLLVRASGDQVLVLSPAGDLADPAARRELRPGDLLEYTPLHQAVRVACRSVRVREFAGEAPDVARKDIGGLDAVWQRIEQEVLGPILRRELYGRYGVSVGRGLLFCGPPGVGKTMMIKAVARAVLEVLKLDPCSPVVLSVPGSSLLRPYVGEGSQLIRAVAKTAEQTAERHGFALILLDDFEYGGGLHRGLGDASSPAYSALTASLISAMDGLAGRDVPVTWAATANRPDLLDSALLRSGRFGARIDVPRPGHEACRQIAEVHLAGRPLADGLTPRQVGEAVADEVFRADEEAVLLRVQYADGGQEDVLPPRVVSGAILAAAVRAAAIRAIGREASADRDAPPGGIRREDLLACLRQQLRLAVASVTPHNAGRHYLQLPEDRRVVAVEQVTPPLEGIEESFVA